MLKRVCDIPNCDATIHDDCPKFSYELDDTKVELELCQDHYEIIKSFLSSPDKIRSFFKGQSISNAKHGISK